MPTFQQAREFLLANRTHYDKAVAGFQWPDPVPFNWALDWFDAELARAADSKDRCALWIVDVATGHETKLTFAELSLRSNQVANYLRQQGLRRGDHLLLVLNNVAPLWEIMLAAMKLGVVVIPATTLLTGEELADRVERGRARMIVADQDQVAKCAGLSRDGVVFVTTSTSPIEGWQPLGDAYKEFGGVHAGRPDQRRRPAAALFHLGHHGQAQAGAAQPSQLPRGRAVDHVLARPAARRRAREHLLARLGQARLEHLLRAVERRRHGPHGQPGAVQRQGAAGCARALSRHHLLRAAHGLAPADPGGSRRLQARPARGLRRRRAAQPRGHQQGPRGVGPHHPRRLRPDRNHRHRRQLAGPDGQAGRDGPAAAGLSRADPRCRRHAAQRGRDLPRPERRTPRRPDAGLCRCLGHAFGRERPGLSHRRRRQPRRGRLPDLRRPRRRRVQVVGLPHQPVRAGKRADRARMRRRSRHRAVARRDPPQRAQGLHPADRLGAAQPRDGAVDPEIHQPAAGAVQAHPPAGIRHELPKTISGKIRRAQLRRVEYEGSAADVARGVEFHEKDLLG